MTCIPFILVNYILIRNHNMEFIIESHLLDSKFLCIKIDLHKGFM